MLEKKLWQTPSTNRMCSRELKSPAIYPSLKSKRRNLADHFATLLKAGKDKQIQRLLNKPNSFKPSTLQNTTISQRVVFGTITEFDKIAEVISGGMS